MSAFVCKQTVTKLIRVDHTCKWQVIKFDFGNFEDIYGSFLDIRKSFKKRYKPQFKKKNIINLVSREK